MTKNLSQRNEFLDYLKGFLIVLVVYGHVLQRFAYHDNGFFEDPVFKFIYLFHMPLFMLVSGYLATTTFKKYNFSQFFSRKTRQLVLPVLSWSLPFTLFLLVLSHQHLSTQFPAIFLAKYWESALGFWFIWALFLGFSVVFVARLFGKAENIVLVLLNFLVLLIPDLFGSETWKFVLPFFCIGYLAASRPNLPRLSNYIYLFFVLLSIVIYVSWKKEFSVYISGMNISAQNIGIIFYRFFASLIVSLTLYEILQRLYSRFPSNLLMFLGRHTLSIYIVEYFFLQLGFHMPLLPHIALFYFLAGPLICASIIYFVLQIEKIILLFPLTRVCFLGQQLPGGPRKRTRIVS